MNEQDILNLIKEDKWMMDVLSIAQELNFPNWFVGAGFVRNKVWDYLHGYTKSEVNTNDIDLVYFDPKGNNQKEDEELSQKLKEKIGIEWEVVNQSYAHTWNNLSLYKSTADAISQWPETATAIGVNLKNKELRLVVPHGIDDLVNLIIRPTPTFLDKTGVIKERAKKKQWLKKWPKLKFAKD